VRACVELDRRKKDRRIQELVIAIQKQGKNPQDYPLAMFKAARDLDHEGSSTVRTVLSTSTRSEQPTTPQRPRTAPEDRDFAHKYNFPIITVPELLESRIHPEDARNQKVLIGAFPR
jgi:CHASE2 domain-containing sensor protein